jgi:hypothetical protein
VSRGDSAAIRECQQLFASFAETSDAPLYAHLAGGIAGDRQLAGLLLAAPPAQRLPVLLFAAVHWLLLADPGQRLARFYPNLTDAGDVPVAGAFPIFREFCLERVDDVVGLVATRRTQTNEIGRTALFVPVLAQLGGDRGTLAHVDVGASAGLNLLISSYDFDYSPGGRLTTGSTVVIACATRGAVPVPAAHPPIGTAIGIDSDPVDVTDPDQARWLEACVWPDQVERFARLEAAIEIATRVGVDVRRGDAAEHVEALVAEASASGHPVVTTSWVLNYLTAQERDRFLTALERSARSVDLSWVYAESPALCPELPGMPSPRSGSKQPTAVGVVCWRRGRREAVYVADAHPHGRWMHWV